MLSLILNGVIGALELDISRSETISRLGLPPSWAGKPFCLGPQVHDPFATDVWFYYNGAVGIGFDQDDFSESVWVLPQAARDDQELFEDWPALNHCLTMGFLRDFLQDHAIRFSECHDDGGVMLTETNTYAYGIPYPDRDGYPGIGKELASFDRRPISHLCHVRHRDLLPGIVREWCAAL